MKNSKTTVLLRNVRTILSDQIRSASILIDNGRIARILEPSSDESVTSESKIDLEGLTLFPGFIDIHIHGAVGVDAMTASADDLSRVAKFLASNGVTAWLPTLVPSDKDQYRNAIASIDTVMRRQGAPDGRQCQARILGVHYEGPFVNSCQCGALHREHFRNFSSPADLDALPTIEQEAIHFMTVAPEIDGGVEVINELRSRGWIVSIGHTSASVEVLDQAFAAGACHLTHFMNAMTPLHHRAPGPVGWGLGREDVTCDVIADGIHIDPLMLKLIKRAKGAERTSLISDAIAATGLGDGDYDIWGEKISVKNGRTQNSRGFIAGSVITMLDSVRTMLSLGESEVDVARMASTNPARLLGIEKECGSIEEGKRADLVVLDQKRNLRLTIVGGDVSEAQS